MANVKKGQLVAAPERWRHLRSWKKVFWKRNRTAQIKEMKDELRNYGYR